MNSSSDPATCRWYLAGAVAVIALAAGEYAPQVIEPASAPMTAAVLAALRRRGAVLEEPIERMARGDGALRALLLLVLLLLAVAAGRCWCQCFTQSYTYFPIV